MERLRIRVRLKATADGGRHLPVVSGYRPAWDVGATYDGKPMQTSGALDLIDTGRLEPCDEGEAWLTPALPEYWRNVTAGQTLHAFEGSRCVASAVVLDAIDSRVET